MISSILFAVALLIIAILLALLIKPRTSTTITTPVVNGLLENPCVNKVYWNTISTVYAGGNALNMLNSPTGITMDSKDNLYISDSGNYRVVKYAVGATNGIVVAGNGVLGNSLDQLSASIRFTYVDSNENIYVSDAGNHRVIRWANGASTGSIVAGNGTLGTSLNQLYSPYSVWLDSNSNLFVAEFQNNRVTQWNPGATAGIVVAGGNGPGATPDKLHWPSSLVYDESNQDLYIINSNSNAVNKWHVGASNGTIVAGTPGSSGPLSTQFSWPLGSTLDRWKNLYIVDRTNFRIQLFCQGNSTGITIAGSATGGSSLALPYGVALDSQLNLYVSDNSDARVYKFNKL